MPSFPGPVVVPRQTLTQAYKLIRQALATSPKAGLSTKDIVREGLTLYDGPLPEPTPVEPRFGKDGRRLKPLGVDPSLLTTEERALHSWKKIKKKYTPEPRLVPEGHPFVSTTFVKREILPTLASLNLVHKHALHADPSRPSSSTRVKGSGPNFVWSLVNEDSSTDSTKSPKSPSRESRPTFSSENQWDLLLQGAHPGEIHAIRKQYLAELAEEQRAKEIESGRARRTDEEVWAWDERRPGITTAPERAHLNKRRERNRPAKEWKAARKFDATPAGQGKPVRIARWDPRMRGEGSPVESVASLP
ncbi:hypothetical protein IAT38_004204 [Cryptococcus sp. DSM 104549]